VHKIIAKERGKRIKKQLPGKERKTKKGERLRSGLLVEAQPERGLRQGIRVSFVLPSLGKRGSGGF